MRHNTVPALTALTALSALAVALSAASPAQAFNPQPDPPGRWAMTGLVADQTLRLSVLAVPVAKAGQRSSCSVTLNFLGADGIQRVEPRTLVLLPGKAQFVDLPGSQLRLARPSDRMQVRTHIELLHNPPAYLPWEGVAATVEVFDASGRTSVLVPHPLQF